MGVAPSQKEPTCVSSRIVDRPWEALHSKKGQVTRETCPSLEKNAPFSSLQSSAEAGMSEQVVAVTIPTALQEFLG